jgi:processive 1,2-diacylglycerol beta-glucosyltransferase
MLAHSLHLLIMRVLIATATAGGGHLAAAAALDEAWRSFRPKDVVEKVDITKFFSALHKKIHADGYTQLVEHAPELWGMMFSKTDDPKAASRLTSIRRLFTATSRRRFRACLEKFQPDLALCTHYLPLEILREWGGQSGRGRGNRVSAVSRSKPIIVSVVTDFEAHALWMDGGVDLYCVAADETGGRLVARGVKREKIAVTGIPISKRFSSPVDSVRIRQALGFRDDLPVILVLSGGFGMGPVARAMVELDKVKKPFQMLAVTGRNAELRQELAVQDWAHPTRVVGFASNMHELMSIAELIVTKPGGLTTSEALAIGRPLLILSPIPGQEAANSDFLLERGAAVKATRVEDISFRVAQLLGSGKLQEMTKAARSLGMPSSAQAVCSAAFALVKSKPDAMK